MRVRSESRSSKRRLSWRPAGAAGTGGGPTHPGHPPARTSHRNHHVRQKTGSPPPRRRRGRHRRQRAAHRAGAGPVVGSTRRTAYSVPRWVVLVQVPSARMTVKGRSARAARTRRRCARKARSAARAGADRAKPLTAAGGRGPARVHQRELHGGPGLAAGAATGRAMPPEPGPHRQARGAGRRFHPWRIRGAAPAASLPPPTIVVSGPGSPDSASPESPPLPHLLPPGSPHRGSPKRDLTGSDRIGLFPPSTQQEESPMWSRRRFLETFPRCLWWEASSPRRPAWPRPRATAGATTSASWASGRSSTRPARTPR